MKAKIKTEEVRRAAKKNKLPMVQREFCSSAGACALSQLYFSKHQKRLNQFKKGADIFPHDFENLVDKWACHKYGKAYTYGFVNGFDGFYPKTEDDCVSSLELKEDNRGFQDGKRIRESLLHSADLCV